MGWWERAEQWQRMEDRCQKTGVVLLLNNEMRAQLGMKSPSPPAAAALNMDVKWAVEIDTELEKRAQQAVAATDPAMYPPSCLQGTEWHKAFVAGMSGFEHSRLCREHAKKEGWIW